MVRMSLESYAREAAVSPELECTSYETRTGGEKNLVRVATATKKTCTLESSARGVGDS